MKDAVLWKKILNEGISLPMTKWFDVPGSPYAGPDRQNELKNRILKSPIIIGSAEGCVRGRRVDVVDYHSIAIPFQEFWIESKLDYTSFPDEVKLDKDNTQYIGSYCVAIKNENSTDLWKIHFGGSDRFEAVFVGMTLHTIDKNGHIASIEDKSDSYSQVFVPDAPEEETVKNCQNSCGWGDVMVFDNLQLMSCRNVQLEARPIDPNAAKRAGKRIGHDASYFRYHVLVVRPPGAKHESKGVEIGSMPRHVCRGHFQHYGPASEHHHPDGKDRGLLFGRIAGRFFIPPCVKGKKEHGVVEKDYLVK